MAAAYEILSLVSPLKSIPLLTLGHAEMAISRQKGVPDTPLATPLTTPRATPRATPLTTPDITPCPSPDREKPPPFPDSSSDASCPNNQQVRREKLDHLGTFRALLHSLCTAQRNLGKIVNDTVQILCC